MKIDINDHRKIFAVQEEFSSQFPTLKIEFLGKPDKSGGPHSSHLVKNPSSTLGECRNIHKKGQISIEPSMTIADLKEVMNDAFGLSIQVLRKSGNDWIETHKDGIQTLEEQNNSKLSAPD